MVKRLPFHVTRSWRYSTGPGDVSLMATAIASSSGAVSRTADAAQQVILERLEHALKAVERRIREADDGHAGDFRETVPQELKAEDVGNVTDFHSVAAQRQHEATDALFGAQGKSDPHLIDTVSLETRIQRVDRAEDRDHLPRLRRQARARRRKTRAARDRSTERDAAATRLPGRDRPRRRCRCDAGCSRDGGGSAVTVATRRALRFARESRRRTRARPRRANTRRRSW